MEKKLKVSDFAGLVGTSQKTIYERINNSSNLPVSEQLISVIEKVRGREVRFIHPDTQRRRHRHEQDQAGAGRRSRQNRRI